MSSAVVGSSARSRTRVVAEGQGDDDSLLLAAGRVGAGSSRRVCPVRGSRPSPTVPRRVRATASDPNCGARARPPDQPADGAHRIQRRLRLLETIATRQVTGTGFPPRSVTVSASPTSCGTPRSPPPTRSSTPSSVVTAGSTGTAGNCCRCTRIRPGSTIRSGNCSTSNPTPPRPRTSQSLPREGAGTRRGVGSGGVAQHRVPDPQRPQGRAAAARRAPTRGAGEDPRGHADAGTLSVQCADPVPRLHHRRRHPRDRRRRRRCARRPR